MLSQYNVGDRVEVDTRSTRPAWEVGVVVWTVDQVVVALADGAEVVVNDDQVRPVTSTRRLSTREAARLRKAREDETPFVLDHLGRLDV